MTMAEAAQAQTTSRGPRQKVLIIEDDADIRELIKFNLEQDGYAVEEAATGAEGLDRIKRRQPDLILLDLMLPGMPGLEICRVLRSTKETATLPILIVTAKGTEVDKVLGLEMGADDYVVKPFSPRELIARVKAVLRRANPDVAAPKSGIWERGRLKMDFDTYRYSSTASATSWRCANSSCCASSSSIRLRVYSREQLLDLVWGRDTFVEPRTVDVHVRRLRQHIEKDDANPELILTVRSVGYRFNPEALD